MANLYLEMTDELFTISHARSLEGTQHCTEFFEQDEHKQAGKSSEREVLKLRRQLLNLTSKLIKWSTTSCEPKLPDSVSNNLVVVRKNRISHSTLNNMN